MGFLEDFIQTNYLVPLCRYYTPVGTITYGILLAIAVFGTYKLLKYLKIDINKNFFIALLPFIIYGGWTRALRDYGIFYEGSIFCSPPIYFIIFLITLGSLVLGLSLQRITSKSKYAKLFEYHKTMFGIGFGLLVFNALQTNIINLTAFLMISGLMIFWTAVFLIIHRLNPAWLSKVNMGIIISHLFDASSTFVAISYFGFYEQHVLPTFLIGFLGPWVMFPLKIFVVWPVLVFIDRSKEDEYFKKFLKIIILILGLALGTRDFLSVSLFST